MQAATKKRGLPDLKIKRSVVRLRLDLIDRDPNQPREQFDPDGIESLARSIQNGSLVQLSVVKHNLAKPGRYLLVAGERRYRALLVLEVVEHDFELIEGDVQDSFILSAMENIHREDLNPIESAKTYTRLHEQYNMSWQAIADLYGLSLATIHNRRKLLDFPWEIQELVIQKKLPQMSALNLAQYKTPRGKMIVQAMALARGEDPLDLGLVGKNPRSDKVIDARLPATPEGQLRRALRSFWRCRGAINAMSEFQKIPANEQIRVLRGIPANTRNALRSTMLDLERVSRGFNQLFGSGNGAAPVAAAPAPAPVPAPVKNGHAALPFMPPKPAYTSADLKRAERILRVVFPRSGSIAMSKPSLAVSLQTTQENAEKSVRWSLRVASYYWGSIIPTHPLHEKEFGHFIADIREGFQEESSLRDVSLFPVFLESLRLCGASNDAIDVGNLWQEASAMHQ